MAKRKASPLEAMISLIFAVGYAAFMAAAIAIVVITITLSNVLSISTLKDYGASLWVANIFSLHVDTSYQATRDLVVYEGRAAIVNNEEPVATIPAGRFFEWNGSVDGEDVSYVAVRYFIGNREQTGFIALAKVNKTRGTQGDAPRQSHVGVIPVGDYDQFRPRMPDKIPFKISAEDESIRDSLWENFLRPGRDADLLSSLTVSYTNNSLEKERIKAGEEFVVVPALGNAARLAYIPAAEKSAYEDILERYEASLDMALYQIDPDFDVLEAIRAGLVPSESNNVLVKLVLMLSALWVVRLWYKRRKGIPCTECGYKSDEHQIVNERSFQRYKYETKDRKPDRRYKSNPIITTTTQILACAKCGEQFRHRKHNKG